MQVKTTEFLPEIQKQKTEVIHSKNPYKISFELPKQIDRVLNGVEILKQSNCEFPEEVIFLNISNENFSEINEEEISYFFNLWILTANFNEIRFHSLVELSNLEELYLDNNEIEEFQECNQVFFELWVLTLKNNKIKEIRNLKQFPNLSTLDLEGNFISEIGNKIFELKKLENLDLSFNYIKDCESFFEELYELEQIKNIKLNNNRIAHLGNKIEYKENVSLQYLNLENNLFENAIDFEAVFSFKNINQILFNLKNKKEQKLLEKQLQYEFKSIEINEENYKEKRQKSESLFVTIKKDEKIMSEFLKQTQPKFNIQETQIEKPIFITNKNKQEKNLLKTNKQYEKELQFLYEIENKQRTLKM